MVIGLFNFNKVLNFIAKINSPSFTSIINTITRVIAIHSIIYIIKFIIATIKFAFKFNG